MSGALLTGLGLVGLFLAGFLAGSAFPFPSEPVLVGLLHAGASPVLAVGAATLGNVAGAITIFAIGRGVVRGKQRWWGEPPQAPATTLVPAFGLLPWGCRHLLAPLARRPWPSSFHFWAAAPPQFCSCALPPTQRPS